MPISLTNTALLRGLACVVAGTLLSLNAASGLLAHQFPRLAMAVNPLNSDARLNVISNTLEQENLTERQIDQLRRDTARLVYFSPSLARGHTLLGELYLREGADTKAQDQFHKALSIHPSEIAALRHRLNRSVETGAWEEAANRLDVYLRRRWRDPEISPIIVALAGDARGADFLRRRLALNPPWRGYVLHVIRKGLDADWSEDLPDDRVSQVAPQRFTTAAHKPHAFAK